MPPKPSRFTVKKISKKSPPKQSRFKVTDVNDDIFGNLYSLRLGKSPSKSPPKSPSKKSPKKSRFTVKKRK